MELNGSKLYEIATKTASALEVAANLDSRQRLRHSTNVRRLQAILLKKGKHINPNEYMQFWKDLQDADVGYVVYGRNGKPDRFHWNYDLKAVAKAMMAGINVEASKTPKVEETPVKKPVPARKAPKRVIVKPEEYKVILVLPSSAKLEKKDINAVCAALLRVTA